MSSNRRYLALNDAMMAARGEDMLIDIQGPTGERLALYAGSIAPESACTSVQLHLQVAPGDFAAYWNAAQAIAGPQLALAANSPFFCGKALWHETRIPLFTQAADTRSIQLAIEFRVSAVRVAVSRARRSLAAMRSSRSRAEAA